MGIIESVFEGLFGTDEVKILLLGLDDAGKTSILYKFKLGQAVVTTPTIGSNVEEISFKNIRFQMWDLGGQQSLRTSWQVYYKNTKIIILVVDSSDIARMHIVRKEMLQLLQHAELQSAKLIVFANKQDKKGALSAAEVSKQLNLHKIKSHTWHIQPTCALTGSGLKDGLEWVVKVTKPEEKKRFWFW